MRIFTKLSVYISFVFYSSIICRQTISLSGKIFDASTDSHTEIPFKQSIQNRDSDAGIFKVQ